MAVYSTLMLSGEAAIAWEQDRGWNQAGACLNTVWQAYGSHQSVGPHAGQYPNAIDGWNYAEQQHPGDTNPPRGVPVYLAAVDGPRWAGDTAYAAGDVCLSLGGGQLLATDWPSSGQIGVCTIEQRTNQTARPYLGWCGDFLGYQVAEGATTTLQEDAMAFPMCFEPNTLVWPNGYASSYDQQTYDAIKSYVEDPTNPGTQWVQETFVRESWNAANFMQQRQADYVVQALQGGGDDPGDDDQQ